MTMKVLFKRLMLYRKGVFLSNLFTYGRRVVDLVAQNRWQFGILLFRMESLS